MGKTIALLGASFDTGNLGVSALAASSIKILLNKWPDAQIVLLGTGRQCGQVTVQMGDRQIAIKTVPVRWCKNIFTPNHILSLTGSVLASRLHRRRRPSGEWTDTKDVMLNADLFCDITGGDSFSDIYGMNRFLRDYWVKRLCQLTGKPFVMLPQTYGPFKSILTRRMAGRILKKTSRVFSRDRQSVEDIKKLIGDSKPVEVVADVAFVLDPVRPNTPQTEMIEQLKANSRQLIGLNISGLLYHGGYTGRNQFGLKVDYPELIQEIISYFISQDNTLVLLVPHVVPENWLTESDLEASRLIYAGLPESIQKNVLIAEDKLDQSQVKYIIGLCGFFLGARMHSTIAAISQCVPAVGMAYSKKFIGVFETAGVADCVIDMRQQDHSQILKRIDELYHSREDTRQRLAQTIPTVKQNALAIFDGL